MVYIVNGNGERTAESHNGEPDAAPILRIKYDGKRPAPGSNLCFSAADGGNVLVTVDTTNGNENLIGSMESPDGDYGTSVEAIAYDSLEGDLYGADQDILGRLDQSSGQFYRLTEFFGTGSGADGNIDFDAVQGLAFERGTSDTVLYAMHWDGSNNYLFLADHETGSHIDNAFDTNGNGSGDADYVEITGAGGQIDDIAIDPSDQTIYVIAGGDELFTVARSDSSSTWSVTSVGTITRTEGGSVPTDIEGLGFDDSGQLFGSTGNSGAGGQNNRIWSIDKSNADATQVGALSEGSDYEALACAFTAATRAVVGGLRAYASAVKGAIVEWQTESERGTLGFHLERYDAETGKYRRLNHKLLPGLLHARNGGLYRFGDLTAHTGEATRYRLVEIEANGGRLVHGPYLVTVATNAAETDYQPNGSLPAAEPGTSSEIQTELAPLDSEDGSVTSNFERSQRANSPFQQARLAAKRKARREATEKKKQRKGLSVKVYVTQTGMYRLDADTLANVMAKPVSKIRQLIRRNHLRMTAAGEEVATFAGKNSNALYFYGHAPEGVYAAENVYWITEGKGLPMRARRGHYPSPVADSSFEHVARAQGNRYSITHLFDDPDGDYWMWDFRFENLHFPMYQDVFNVSTPGRVSDSSARLTVRLHGGSKARHRASVMLNGHAIGSTSFDGLVPHTVTFVIDSELINDGDNDIQLYGASSGDADNPSTFYLNDLMITYFRAYSAVDDALTFSSSLQAVQSISNFTSPDIEIFELQDHNRPRHLSEVAVDGGDNNYRVSFRSAKQPSRYIALDLATALVPQRVIADRSSSLSHRRNRADYLIVTSSDMLETAQRLADFRARSQSLQTLVVDIEDVYDEFNHGVADPDALWRFLRHAHTKWRTSPRYVVLAGEGSFDYKNFLGHGDSIIPTLLTPTPHGLFPSDNLYADVLGNDWLPEMSIGRLPVIDAGELQVVIEKLMDYESTSGNRKTKAIFAADAADLGGDFPRVSDAIAAHLPSEYTIERIYLDEVTPVEARTTMLAGINAGRAFINFVGHSGFTNLGNAGLLTAIDAASLNNRSELAVLTAFTCLAGQFGFPGQESLGEAMLLSPGGAVAVWAPSGLSLNPWLDVWAKAFTEAFSTTTSGFSVTPS